MLQIKHSQSRGFVTDTFTHETEDYNFRQNQDFTIPSENTVYRSSESTSYLGPKNWETVPVKINGFDSPNNFKKQIRN